MADEELTPQQEHLDRVVQRQVIGARSDRRDFYRFKALIATPGSLATGISLPARAALAVSCATLTAVNSPMVTINGRTVNAPPAAANTIHRIGLAERGREILVAGAAPGVVSLYVVDSFGRHHKIAEG